MWDVFEPPVPMSADQKWHWGNLQNEAQYLALLSWSKRNKRPIVLLADDLQQAQQAEHILKVLDPSESIYFFPDWELLPYDHFSAHRDIISNRLQTLYQLKHLQQGIVICAVSTALYYLPPELFLQQHTFMVKKGAEWNLRAQVEHHFVKLGYVRVSQVMEHGEFSVKGSIVDIFLMGSAYPLRIECFDQQIESLRYFDPGTQISIKSVEEVVFMPAYEYPLDSAAVAFFREQWRSRLEGLLDAPLYQQVSQGQPAAGLEFYLPLFFETLSTFWDYVPNHSVIVCSQHIDTIIRAYRQEMTERYEQLRYDRSKPILPPSVIALNAEIFFEKISSFFQIHTHAEALANKKGYFSFDYQVLPGLACQRQAEDPWAAFKQFMATFKGAVLICVSSSGRREVLLEVWKDQPIMPVVLEGDELLSLLQQLSDGLYFITLPLEKGFITGQLAFITESDLWGTPPVRQKTSEAAQDPEQMFKSLAELKSGALVVHRQHGIGRYLGLEMIKTRGLEAEFFALEYADQAKIYVPIADLNYINRYTGLPDQMVTLTRLGSSHWDQAKEKAAKRIRDVAVELLEIYSQRQAEVGFAFPKPDTDYQRFRQEFPFEETPDQRKAIDAVIYDMTSKRSMDRLICGDVGFGKTEVAMQAAFLAAHAGKQVAVLVPTTLLAEQHYRNFRDRFANWPVKIGVLSRLQAKKIQEKNLAELKQGVLDIVIGTHKLLQSLVEFKDLGLLIVDEEHRFGVQQKEKMKKIRAHVDILTLTATPIPRTLNMSLAGIRDLSIIATPPTRRLSVKTFLCESKANIIREAVLREIYRGGQVYFLHNQVSSIEMVKDRLAKIVPEASIGVGHGQLSEHELEHVMSDFYKQRFQILLCTTIIESGIDIPTANTILIDDAHCFGLAALYQLRGRVGRSHHQAYAYLLVPDLKNLKGDAYERLNTLTQYEELGSGFLLASQDLEIRGAGELLGGEQSGHVETIGFSLYMEMLNQAVDALKSGQELEFRAHKQEAVEINLNESALITKEYVGDPGIRLNLYKRLSECKDLEAIQQFKFELIDRFGSLPSPTQVLFELAQLRLTLQPLGVRRIEVNAQFGYIEFYEKHSIDPLKILKLIQEKPGIYQLQGNYKLRFSHMEKTAEGKIKFITELLTRIG